MSIDRFSLKVTPKAYNDLDEIYAYITNKLFDEVAADRVLSKIENSIMRLKQFPYSCSLVRDEFLHEKGYRLLVVDHYIALYLLNEAERQVIIVRVLYGKQNYQDLL